MLRSVKSLFARYCDVHFRVTVPGFPLFGPDGSSIGHVDKVHFGTHSVELEGWTLASGISLAKRDRYTWETPRLARPDVSKAHPEFEARTPGFRISALGTADEMCLSIRSESTMIRHTFAPLSRSQMKRAKLRLFLHFLRDITSNLGVFFKAAIRPTHSTRQKARRALRIGSPVKMPVWDPAIVNRGKSPQVASTVTLVVPVYNAIDVLKECLGRVARHTDVPWRMILIEDASTDPRVLPWITAWADRQCAAGNDVQVLQNKANLGFVKSVNRALQAALVHGDHVILLNSDALVPDRWASRLVAPILQSPKVASVTPFSNDAELMSVPQICERLPLVKGAVDKIDSRIRGVVSVSATLEVPTGVGFCMAMNARFLRQLPAFDTIFGPGYGEEVDWCQKARKLGGINLVQPALFIEHKGGASFGSDEKLRLIAQNNRIVSNRYPDFDANVQSFIAADPLFNARFLHSIAMICAAQSSVEIFIAHSMGGGAEHYLTDRISGIIARGQSAIVLRAGGSALWKVELHSSLTRSEIACDSQQDVLALLRLIPNRHVVYSCGVGHPEPTRIPELLTSLAQGKPHRLDILIHDYYPLSEAYTLLNDDGVFIDETPLGARDTKWRTHWQPALNAADEIICFSNASRRHVEACYPDCASKLVVKPHPSPPLDQVHASPRSRAIGILGDIGAHKGAELVSLLSRMTDSSNRPIAIIGQLDPAFALGANGTQSGSYQKSDIPLLAMQHGIACWFIPSIWPETFSYTTHEALATGLPVFTFDIGGQGEAARAARNGHTIPISLANHPKDVSDYINGVLRNGANRRSFDQKSKGSRRRGFAA